MSTLRILTLVLAVLVVAGCNGGSTDRPSVVVRDSAGVRIVESATQAWTVETTWRLGTQPHISVGGGTTDGEQLFQVVGALRLADGRIVVANSGTHELRFYSEEGTMVSASAGQGSGPGEFERLHSIHRHGSDSLAAFDTRHRRASVFDVRGAFSRTMLLQHTDLVGGPRLEGVLDDGSLVIRVETGFGGDAEPGLQRPTQLALRLHADLTRADTLGVFPGTEYFLRPLDGGRGIVMPHLFGHSTTLRASSDRVYVADNATYSINIFDPKGTLQTIVRRHHPAVLVTGDDIDRARTERLAGVTGNEARRGLADVLQEMPMPDAFPAYADIRLDALGNLWVEEYARPGDQRVVWTVFDGDGTWLGPVEFPPGFEPLDIGDDYVLGRWRDQLDVEQVQLYELRKP